MALLNVRTLILAKKETTYGTDPTPTVSANAVVAYDVEITPEIDMIERRDMGPTLGREKELSGIQRATVKFTTHLRGGGTAGTAPKGVGDLFQACGMSETIVAVTSVTYAFISASIPGVTIWVYKDGVRHVLNGCLGNFEIVYEAGQVALVNWEFMGLYATPTDVTLPTNATPDTTVPKVCKNLTATLDSYGTAVSKITLKSNNTVTERPALDASTGLAGYQITDRNPEGSIVVESVLLATKNWYTKWEANTNQALSVALSNGAGNIVTVTASQCISRSKEYTDLDGVLADEISFQLAKSSTTANDEISIALT